MSPNPQIEVLFDFARDGTYTHAQSVMTGRVIGIQANQGMDKPYGTVSPPAQMTIVFTNADGAFNPDDTDSPLYGLLNPGVLVRYRVFEAGTWYTRFIGHVAGNTQYTVGKFEVERRANVTVVCPMNRLYNDLYQPALETNVTTDAPLATMFDKPIITWPYDRSFFILGASALDGNDGLFDPTNSIYSMETGKTTQDYVGDVGDVGGGMSPFNFITQQVDAEMGGRFYWDAQQAQFFFHNRHHDTLNQGTVADQFDLAGDVLRYQFGQQVIYNDVTIQYTPRTLGSAGSVLFTSDAVPFLLRAHNTRVINGRYRDPNNESAVISADTVIQPVATTDYTANTASDGGGTDVTANLGITSDLGGQMATIILNNNTTTDMYITLLQVRGTPLARYNVEQATHADAQSIYDYQRSPHPPITINGLNDADTAEDYARFLVRRFKNPISAFSQITLRASQSAALLARGLAISLMDQITLVNNWAKHSAQYVVMGLIETWDAESRQYDITMIVKPFTRESVFRLDYSMLSGTDGLAF